LPEETKPAQQTHLLAKLNFQPATVGSKDPVYRAPPPLSGNSSPEPPLHPHILVGCYWWRSHVACHNKVRRCNGCTGGMVFRLEGIEGCTASCRSQNVVGCTARCHPHNAEGYTATHIMLMQAWNDMSASRVSRILLRALSLVCIVHCCV